MISKKMKELVKKSEAISALFSESRRMKEEYGEENVYDFGIGNPNVEAPKAVNETAVKILKEMPSLKLHGYTDNSGFFEVREKIAEALNKRFGTAYHAKNIIMTNGAAGGLNVILKTLLDAGDEVLTFAPYFGEYDCFAENAGGVLKTVPPAPPTFLPDMEELEKRIGEKTKVVLVNTPNNPTGVVYDEKTIRELSAVLERRSKELGRPVYLVSDEPYRELVFDGATVPYIPDFYKNTIVAYSYSKSLSLPGDRIGYLTVPDEVEDCEDILYGAGVANRILGFVNAPALQQLVVAECQNEKTDLSYYDKNRELLYEGLKEMGFSCAKPQGAFYLFIKTPEPDDKAFCERAKKYRVLITPGSGFGCSGYARIAYCVARETIENSMPAFRMLAEEYKEK